MKTAALALIALLLAPQTSGRAAAPKAARLDVHTLSTSADRVTGGDVLVAIVVPAGPQAPAPQVRLNRRDVSDAFRRQDRSFIGLVTGLVDVRNESQVSGWGVCDQLLALTNYAISGPVISVPHHQPFVCQSDAFKSA